MRIRRIRAAGEGRWLRSRPALRGRPPQPTAGAAPACPDAKRGGWDRRGSGSPAVRGPMGRKPVCRIRSVRPVPAARVLQFGPVRAPARGRGFRGWVTARGILRVRAPLRKADVRRPPPARPRFRRCALSATPERAGSCGFPHAPRAATAWDAVPSPDGRAPGVTDLPRAIVWRRTNPYPPVRTGRSAAGYAGYFMYWRLPGRSPSEGSAEGRLTGNCIFGVDRR